MIAIGCDAADAAYAEFKRRGVPVEAPRRLERDVFVCAPDARTTAGKFASLFETAAEPAAEGEWRLALARGSIRVVTPAAWAQWAPAAPTPPPPSPVGIGFRVASIAATRSLLASRGVEVSDGRDRGIWVGPADACGAALYFFED